MRLSHARGQITARFDDPNLVSCAGLVAVSALATRAGLPRLLERLTVPAPNAVSKLLAVVLGMVAGADSISDLGVLRHGGMRRLFAGVRAPSTLGTFLRGFTFGHVRQLDAVAARLLPALTRWAPLLAGGDELAYLVLDGSKALAAGIREVFDHLVIQRRQLHKLRNARTTCRRSCVRWWPRGCGPPRPSSRPWPVSSTRPPRRRRLAA